MALPISITFKAIFTMVGEASDEALLEFADLPARVMAPTLADAVRLVGEQGFQYFVLTGLLMTPEVERPEPKVLKEES